MKNHLSHSKEDTKENKTAKPKMQGELGGKKAPNK